MSDPEHASFAEKTRGARWIAAVAVAAAALIVFAVNPSLIETCGQQAISAGENLQRLERVCTAPAATDFQTLALVFVLGLLVLPDFSEIGFGQVLTLKSKVRDQETKQAKLQDDVTEIARVQAVSAATASAGARSDTTIQLNSGFGFSLADGVQSSVQKVGELQVSMAALEERLALVDAGRIASDTLGGQPVLASLEPSAARPARILWVDDKPANNVVERSALTARQHTIVTALSTNDALRHFDEQPFDIVITDLGRSEDGNYVRDAGIRLIRALGERGVRLPILVYSRVTRRDTDDDRVSQLNQFANVHITQSIVREVEKVLEVAPD